MSTHREAHLQRRAGQGRGRSGPHPRGRPTGVHRARSYPEASHLRARSGGCRAGGDGSAGSHPRAGISHPVACRCRCRCRCPCCHSCCQSRPPSSHGDPHSRSRGGSSPRGSRGGPSPRGAHTSFECSAGITRGAHFTRGGGVEARLDVSRLPRATRAPTLHRPEFVDYVGTDGRAAAKHAARRQSWRGLTRQRHIASGRIVRLLLHR